MPADLLTEEGRISVIGQVIVDSGASRVIDATGMYILPGSVDPHVHVHLPTAAGYSSDDFLTGSRAALFGGTTTIIDFVTPDRGESLPRALEKRMREAENSMTDYSFHVSPVEWRNSTADEIKECIRMGATSFKVYMAYKKTIGLDDEDLLKVMNAAGRAGGIVTVHCEEGDKIEVLRDKYYIDNHTSPIFHALSRPAHLEAAAVKKAIELAAKADCPLYIVHVSSGESLLHIRIARSKGQTVYGETCPQYLLLDDAKYIGTFGQTAPYVISPPLRTTYDNNALWEALADGTLSTVGTDHCPFTMAQKRAGMDDFRKIPGGAGGVEHRLSLLFTYGVLTKRLTFNQMVNLVSSKPSEIFGISPGKGSLMEGSDADMVIWNPEPESIISVKSHHMNCDINLYEGIPVKGRAEYVIRGGNVVIETGSLVTGTSPGRFLSRTI
ncbi:MAG: dihydropyrimidinase [Bacteroidales bacterium]|nr:dihydropyrimidinase [Bacteroidales bacterium]